MVAPKKKKAICLYISGDSPRSRMIVARLNTIFEEYFDQAYELEVVDITQSPEIAIEKQIIATPTFIKNFPPPPLRIIGEMNDQQFLLEWLAIDASTGGRTDLGDAP